MARSIYVMPITGSGTSHDPKKPKYQDAIFPDTLFRSTMFDYGDEPWCLVGITDITPAADSALVANGDVFKLPDNLDTTMGNNATRNQVRTRLEQNEFPGTWVQTTTTFREVVLVVGACCQYAQRFQGLETGLAWFSGTVHVTSNYGTLSQEVRDSMVTAATSFGFNTSAFILTNTIRDVLKSVADQYILADMPLDLQGSLYG